MKTRLLLTTILCVAASLASQRAQAATPQTFIGSAGLYGLLPVNIEPSAGAAQRFLEHPDFAGISIRTEWGSLEPVEDAYDWSYIDEMMALAGSYDKQVVIRIAPGWHTPDWVYDSGAEPFDYVERHNEGTSRMPIPWDGVFLRQWGDFLAALGQRYNDDPRLAVMIITGASRSTEMYLPLSPEDSAHWAAVGYTPERMIGAWSAVIDHYAAAFPNKPWLLAVSAVLDNDGVVEAVVDYGVESYPWQFNLKIAYWSSTNNTSAYPTAKFLSSVDERTHGGLEPVNGLGDEQVAIDLALAWRTITWIEPYEFQKDILGALSAEQQRRKQMVSSSFFDAIERTGGGADLVWKNPSGYAGFKEVRVVRKQGGYPSGADDPAATTVYQGVQESILDPEVAVADDYYYSLYELPSEYVIGQGQVSTAGSTSAVTFAPRADGIAWSSHPERVFGSFRWLVMRSDERRSEAHVAFDVVGGGPVQSATLWLKCKPTVSGTVTVHAGLDADWDEATLSWDTRGGYGAALDTVLVAADDWYAFDVSSHVSQEGAFSFTLTADGDGHARCASRESSDGPALEVVW